MTTCQPKAKATADLRFLPACECGWEALFSEEDRASALVRAYRHDAEKNRATS